MTSASTTSPSRRFTRFSIRFLFGLTAFSAVLMGIWKAFIYEPPTHKVPAYEKAPGTRRLAAQVGPNTISIRSVARNDRDGSISIESGGGKSLPGPVPGKKLLSSCAKWLDVVQVELHPGPDRFEIIEARVFDHASRTLLSQVDPAFGWQVVEPNLLQVYGLGKEVPPLVDVWLRVHSYRPEDRAFVLPPKAGSKVSFPGGTMTLREIQNGFAGWSSSSGFVPVGSEHDGETALVLQYSGNGQDERYQVAAVSTHGEKQFEDRYLSLGTTGGGQNLIRFDFPLDEIEHIELRPHGGRHRFFFEAVRLPKASGRSFADPPIVRVPVNQGEMRAVLSELAPLQVRLAVMNGDCATGSTSNGRMSRIIMRPEPRDADQAFTLSYDVKGIAGLQLSVGFQDSQTGNIVPETAFGSRGSYRASTATRQSAARTFSTPIDRVEAVEVSVQTDQ